MSGADSHHRSVRVEEDDEDARMNVEYGGVWLSDVGVVVGVFKK